MNSNSVLTPEEHQELQRRLSELWVGEEEVGVLVETADLLADRQLKGYPLPTIDQVYELRTQVKKTPTS